MPRRKLAWIALLYFAEGLPFGIVKQIVPVYFKVSGVSLTAIGLASLLGLPWTFKFLWSPLIDRFGERRLWISSCLIALAVLAVLVPNFDPAALPIGLWAILLAMAVASATQDMAIDAYTIGLVSPGEEGEANGVRVSAYRIALITAGGGLVFLAPTIGWRAVFTACAVLLTILAVATWRAPRVVISIERRRDWRKPIVRWLSRSGAWAVFLFAFSYKLGHAAIGPMIKPFWIDRGLSLAEVGIVSTSFGTAVTIAGALLGGWITTRWGIFRALLLIGLVHAVSNLGYATVAWINPPQPQLVVASLGDVFRALGEPGRSLIYAASMLESFCEGLGDATLLAFLMHVCEKEHAAVEFAALSATAALSVSVCGAISGWATTRLGYGPYFLLTFFLGFPALTLLPILRPWIHDRDVLPTAPRLRSAR